jgi:hypothetical protein
VFRQKFWLAWFAISLAATTAAADDLAISLYRAEQPDVHDFTWNSGNPSPDFMIGTLNTTGTTNQLFAWQLSMRIVPLGMTSGSLEFGSTATPSSNYLLAGAWGPAPNLTAPSATIDLIGDGVLTPEGVIVPGSGANLLEFTLSARPGTAGRFQIEAIPDPIMGCGWFDSDFSTLQNFSNVPFDGQPVALGTIDVVPEPGTMMLTCSAVATLILVAAKRRGMALR